MKEFGLYEVYATSRYSSSNTLDNKFSKKCEKKELNSFFFLFEVHFEIFKHDSKLSIAFENA